MEQTRPKPNRAPRWRQRKAASRRSELHGAAQLQNAASAAAAVAAVPSPPSPPTVAVPNDTLEFSELGKNGLIHPKLLDTLTKDMGFKHMTPVQEATLRPLLTERADILAQAKTGTGKTVAFLLPAIQRLVTQDQKPGASVSLLVISPTRELAIQIADEAKAMLKRFPQYSVQTAIGGTNKDTEESRILKSCDILVATPGRLMDHMETEGTLCVMGKLQNVQSLVLDEADRLLDMGFQQSIKKIIKALPRKETTNRQGVLFSATVPARVKEVAHLALSQNYQFISTISEGEVNTHERVPQDLVMVPNFSDQAAALIDTINHEIEKVGRESFKAIVFAPTAQHVEYYAEIVKRTFNDTLPTSALHSRLTQSRRIRLTEEFRDAKNGLVVATDVIARGMDFPRVTNVIQVGLPFDKETYVHRLGRTARAGADGRGTLILAEAESYFIEREIGDIKMRARDADLRAREGIIEIARSFTFGKSSEEAQIKVYQAWLGFYKSYARAMGWDTKRLVKEANLFAKLALGYPGVPPLAKRLVGKMGLKGVPGLNIESDTRSKGE
ncbi:P-loop containing nucleoside triphosphate hydrolase protein [Camillea tinctor]|nr:P-loop containing nucleoside triphosphate hydrolase protein [Camillea tinctor]